MSVVKPTPDSPAPDEGPIPLAPEKAGAEVRRPAVTAAAAAGPPWPMLAEGTSRRWLPAALLLIITGLFGYMMATLWAGAHGGVDQAGYMLTARLILGDKNPQFAGSTPLSPPLVKEVATTAPADATAPPGTGAPAHSFLETFNSWFHFARPVGDALRGRLSFVPESAFQFGSRMSIMTEPFHDPAPGETPYRIYAKYPFGFSLLAALGRLVTGRWDGMYMVNPFCTVLAVFCSYFLFRSAVSRFAALMGTILLACNPLVLIYANDANSHATTLLAVVAGFWGLLSWWKTKVWWRGFLGAFALGYACTIRYSEFLLVLPVLFAAATNFRWNKKAAWNSGAVLLGWAIPVAALALVCWISFGAPWKTGYSYCKEDTGFAWKYFFGDSTEPTNRTGAGNWETFIQQMNHTGLFALWPLALAGLMGMMGKSWRLGATLGLWLIPTSTLYMFYYWAPQGENVTGYLRFFVSTIPGFILAALWLVDRAMAAHPGEKWASLIAATVFAALAGTWLVYHASPADHAAGLIGFVSAWTPALAVAAAFLALIGLMWRFERSTVPARVGLALAMAALVGVTSGVNAYTFAPQLEGVHYGQTNLRFSVDQIRSALPAGALLFADESMCQQLDSIGGYQLFSTDLFQYSGFKRYKDAFDRKERTAEAIDEPAPLQFERAAYYMSLLGRKNPYSGVWTERDATDLANMQRQIVDRALARGQRVAFLVTSPDGPDADDPTPWRSDLPSFGGLVYRELAHWQTLPPLSADASTGPRWWGLAVRPAAAKAAKTPKAGAGGAGKGNGPRGLGADGGRAAARGTGHWYLIELAAPGSATRPTGAKRGTAPTGALPTHPNGGTTPAQPHDDTPAPTGRVDFFGLGADGRDVTPPASQPGARSGNDARPGQRPGGVGN